MDLKTDLERKLGLNNVEYKHNLSKQQLFREALRNDRGRTRVDGPDSDRKAYATALGEGGPLPARGLGVELRHELLGHGSAVAAGIKAVPDRADSRPGLARLTRSQL